MDSPIRMSSAPPIFVPIYSNAQKKKQPVLLNVVPQFRSLHKCRFTNHLAAYLGTRFITDPTARLDTTPYYARNSGASTLDLDLATSSLLQLHAFFLRLGQSSNVKTLDFPFTLKPLAAKILPGLSAGDEMEVDEVEEEEEEGHPEPGSESEEEEDGAEEPILPVIDLMRQHVAIGEEPSPPPTGSSIRGYATILDRSGATQIRVWWQMRDELTNRILFSSLVRNTVFSNAHNTNSNYLSFTSLGRVTILQYRRYRS